MLACIATLVSLCVFCLALSGCGYGLEDDFPLDEMGTTNANMYHTGTVVEKNGWIYYTNAEDVDRLYRRNSDGTINERIGNHIFVYYINVIGDRIWYIKGAKGAIYEMRIREDGSVYKRRKLDARPCGDLMAAGGFLFYIVYPAAGDRWAYGELYRLDLRSGEKKLLEKDVTSYGIHDGSIYFGHCLRDADSSESVFGLCKTDFSGDGYTILVYDNPYYINIVEDTVYYASYEDRGVYRVHAGGGERQELPEAWLRVDTTDEFIYYAKRDEEYPTSPRLWRMNLDGSDDIQIFEDRTAIGGITEHMLFFSRSNKSYVSDLDGANIRPWP
jgi:hypothetical protein